jgi:cell division protease FtsH
MSDKLGMIQYGDNNEYVFLGREMIRSKDYSERIAQEIDAEVKRIIDEQFKTAKDLIDTHRDKLELIAQSLLEYETLEGMQVEEIIRTGRMTPPPKNSPDLQAPTGAVAATPLPEVPKPAPPHLPGLGSPAPAAA